MGKYNFELDLYDDNTISWIADRVAPNSKVLEFGPAHGRLTKYLKEQKKCIVDIVEIDMESGLEAALYAEDALLGEEKGNIEKYYWLETKKKYDFIIFADVLEHLVNPDVVLKRCKNVINEKGKILVSIPNISHNSIIIDLINDKFDYNPTGILDNTHLKFFTRRSFENMAVKAGWAVLEEKAKSIRAGETEIKNSYRDIPLNLRKELMHRPQGDIYQYMFTLAATKEYLLGEEYRKVSLDSTSYYYAELQYSNDGEYDYRKSISRHYDPYYGKIKMKFILPEDANGVLIKPINSNCVIENIVISICGNESKRTITDFESNAKQIGNRYYSLNEPMELHIDLNIAERIIEFEADIKEYDFEQSVLNDLLNNLIMEQNHIKDICDTYEKELSRREKEYICQLEEKEKALLDSVAVYEKELNRREEEYRAKEQEYIAREQEYITKEQEYMNRKGLKRWV